MCQYEIEEQINSIGQTEKADTDVQAEETADHRPDWRLARQDAVQDDGIAIGEPYVDDGGPLQNGLAVSHLLFYAPHPGRIENNLGNEIIVEEFMICSYGFFGDAQVPSVLRKV